MFQWHREPAAIPELCQHIPHTQWNQLLAVWRSRLHQEQRLRLRTSYIRGGAFSQCVNLFTDLSHCRPSVARSIHRWVLGQLPHYPSGCRGCGAERLGQRHVLECLHINPDLAISLGFYELAALALRRMEGFLIAYLDLIWLKSTSARQRFYLFYLFIFLPLFLLGFSYLLLFF
jgi:hypothetical protein